MGPKVSPKNVINTHIPIIIDTDYSIEYLNYSPFLKKNAIATIPRHTVHTEVPSWIKNFLPFLFINEILITDAITETK